MRDQVDNIQIPEVLPLLPVRDVVIFPLMVIPLFVGRESSVNTVEEAVSRGKLLFIATQKDPNVEHPDEDDIYEIGVVAMVMRVLKIGGGKVKILVQGIKRGKIEEYVKKEPNFEVRIQVLEDIPIDQHSLEVEALIRSVKEQNEHLLSLKGMSSPEMLSIINNVEEPSKLADLILSNLKLKTDEAQKLLEILDPLEKLKRVNEILAREIELYTMQVKIQSQAKEEMTKTQREYFLREQLKAIKSELGDIDDREKEIDEYRTKIMKAKMPKEVEEEALKQLRRLEQMHPDTAEASTVRTYLDWLVELPWSISTKDNLDIKRAQKILDEDHYNLEKVKERILEYLSVKKISKKMKGPILCFVGPPGVGKTSLGKSIARALGRKFVRISLGGIKDEAEIRGHRRTYVGALPGRIIQGIKQAKSNNPVFMMDEVDKIGADFRGDPASALLEVLDPEQNNAFSDHYLNVPFDLSKVMFITTANLLDPIPSALRDRMEVIYISGYTAEEKLHIAKQFLIPKQMKENGISKRYLKISDEALMLIITQYTKESGVRNLEREIATICRKIARKIAEGEKKKFIVTKANLHKLLGPPKYIPEAELEENEIGVATGLAWTEVGGEVLYIEAVSVKGKGNLTLTGHLGDVMKESAKAALSYARSKAKRFNLDEDFYEKLDIHIHIPAGAIPKDGPSAGVTMAVALISNLTKIPVKKSVAMTGEITLRGKILPVGGLKEKILAALRAKIEKVIIPYDNLKDLEEIPKYVKRKIEIIPVKHMDEVLDIALAREEREKFKKVAI